MNKINTILIDDEEGALNTLRGMIYKFCPNVHIVAEASTPADAVEKIRKHKPDLLLMDIEMPPYGTSFDIIKQIEDIEVGIILITAYPEYAVDAINVVQPWGYLVKPFSIVKLQAALAIAEQKVPQLTPNRSSAEMPDFLITDSNQSVVVLNPSDIILWQADESMVELLVARRNDTEIIRTTRTLKKLETQLPENLFYRTHHGFIVNVLFIDRWVKTGRNGLIYMKNGMRVPISVQKMPNFEARMNIGQNH